MYWWVLACVRACLGFELVVSRSLARFFPSMQLFLQLLAAQSSYFGDLESSDMSISLI
jgi:hypothetical protein